MANAQALERAAKELDNTLRSTKKNKKNDGTLESLAKSQAMLADLLNKSRNRKSIPDYDEEMDEQEEGDLRNPEGLQELADVPPEESGKLRTRGVRKTRRIRESEENDEDEEEERGRKSRRMRQSDEDDEEDEEDEEERRHRKSRRVRESDEDDDEDDEEEEEERGRKSRRMRSSEDEDEDEEEEEHARKSRRMRQSDEYEDDDDEEEDEGRSERKAKRNVGTRVRASKKEHYGDVYHGGLDRYMENEDADHEEDEIVPPWDEDTGFGEDDETFSIGQQKVRNERAMRRSEKARKSRRPSSREQLYKSLQENEEFVEAVDAFPVVGEVVDRLADVHGILSNMNEKLERSFGVVNKRRAKDHELLKSVASLTVKLAEALVNMQEGFDEIREAPVINRSLATMAPDNFVRSLRSVPKKKGAQLAKSKQEILLDMESLHRKGLIDSDTFMVAGTRQTAEEIVEEVLNPEQRKLIGV